MTILVIFQNLLLTHFRQKAVDDLMIKESRVLTSMLADNVRLAVFSENIQLLKAAVDAVLEQDDIVEAAVIDDHGHLLASACRADRRAAGNCGAQLTKAWEELGAGIGQSRQMAHTGVDGNLVFVAPVLIAGGDDQNLYFDNNPARADRKKLIGFTSIAFDNRMFEVGRRHALSEGIAIAVLFFLLTVTATWLIVRTATRPLSRLIRLVKESDLPAEGPDEMALLSESFSSIIDQLSDSFSTINRLKKELEDLARELIRTREQERTELAFDLHDNIAQELSSLKIFCANIEREWPGAPAAVGAELEMIGRSLSTCINAVRELSYDLSPPDLKQLGLVSTVRHLCDEFSGSSGVETDFLANGFDDFEPDPELATNCYRIVQEALRNVRKHAGASRVEVKLLKSHPKVILRIRDDGCGFEVVAVMAAAVATRRMGLKSIEKRATLSGGDITIESQPGKGTRIMVELPYGKNDE
jgi:signal transduction histidine kinase